MLSREEREKLNDLRLQFIRNAENLSKHANDPMAMFWRLQQEALQAQIHDLECKEEQ